MGKMSPTMNWHGYIRGLGIVLAAVFAAGITTVAVIESTHNLVLRVLGIVFSIATFRVMLILDAPSSHSTINRVATTAVGLPICWPVFDLFRYWLGLDAYWSPTRLEALGLWRIVRRFVGIWYLPIMVVCGGDPITRARRGLTH